MKEQEVIRAAMKAKGMSQAEVAKACGFKGQSSVSMLLQGKSMRVDNLVKVLSACGYEVMVVDREKRGPSYVITGEGEDGEAEVITSDAAESGSNYGADADGSVLRELVSRLVHEEIGRIVREEIAGDRRTEAEQC